MNVVSDSSPLITLARIGCFELLRKLSGEIHIPHEVYREIVISGAGLPGSAEVSCADWIRAGQSANQVELTERKALTGLGSGEVSAVMLALQIPADLVLIDEWKARQYARAH